MSRLLTFGRSHRNTAIQAHLQGRRPLALLVTLVLCLLASIVASILSSNEAWAKEQPSSGGPTPTTPLPPPVSATPATETPPIETLPPPPSEPVPPEAEPEPAPQPTPLQHTVMIITSGGETVWPSAEPVSTYWQSEPTPTESTSAPMPYESWPETASATPTPDLGASEMEVPAAAAEEVPAGAAGVPAAAPSAPPSEGSAPTTIPTPPALQQVAPGLVSLQGAASQQEQARPGYSSSSGIALAGTAVQPLTRPLTNFVGTSTAAVVNTAANVLGAVRGLLAEVVPSGGADSSSSSASSSSGVTTTPEPFAPVSPQPLGGSSIALFSGGGGHTSAGGAGASILLLGVLVLVSTLLLRRDFRMYLVSWEVPKPSSALLSPLERPG